ncbi:ComF family protein [Flavilitoribacter nigricans]|uniref:ComF family protein n=1 Tax=Flavilitoribacter nigricans TaxID=70997 RepID=UPI001626948C|nr:phosphoribosyltransferase family protein [Flavilitoribacter nigricans]
MQRLIHQLKYHHRPEIGYQLGLIHGRYLRESPYYSDVDLVVPVPLHPKKHHTRGYNQSDHYARGLAEGLQVDWAADVLIRRIYTRTQTKKSRLERLDNVEAVFGLAPGAAIAGRHLLLVDDVITTGATLEACGIALQKAPGVRLSMATIGFAT